MRVLTIFLTILVFWIPVRGQQQDPAAEPYLVRASESLDSDHTIRIDFKYTREDLQSESILNGEGVFYLFGEMYRIELDEAIIWFDGEKQYSLNKEVEEVYISIPDPENKEFMFTDPIKLLRNFSEEFKYILLGDGEIKGIDTKIIQLDPIELGGPYAVLKLFFEQASNDLIALQVRHKEGILYTMIITEMTDEKERSSEFYRFNETQYPMVDIIELIN